MIVKLAAARKSDSSFTALAEYITSEDRPGEKIRWTEYTNLHAEDVADAISHVAATQNHNLLTKSDKTYHLIIAFPLGETPDRDVIHDIENELMESIHMQDFQRISAVHTDTNHLHLHVALNKIHPHNFNNFEPFQCKAKLQLAARSLENKHGLQPLIISDTLPLIDSAKINKIISESLATPDCTWITLQKSLAKEGLRFMAKGRGLVITDRSGKNEIKSSAVARGFSRARLEERLGEYNDHFLLPTDKHVAVKARTMEAHSNLSSFQSWSQKHLAASLVETLSLPGCDWMQIQQVLADAGVRFKTRGRGLVITDRTGKYHVKASLIDRSLSRANLEDRLGQFVDHEIPLRLCQYAPSPSTKPGRDLFDEYQGIKRSNMTARKDYFQGYTERKKSALATLRLNYQEQRMKIWAETSLTKRSKWLIMLKLKAVRTQEHNRIIKEFADQRDSIKKDTHTDSWPDYLIRQAESGSSPALQALRRSKAVRSEEKPVITGNYLTGQRRTAEQIMAALPAGFRVHKNGDISIQTFESEKIVLRANRLYIVGQSVHTHQSAANIARKLFVGRFNIIGDRIHTAGIEQ